MRINKYLAQNNIASRREADRLIESKKVFINGKLARLGDDVSDTDKIEIKKDKKDIGRLYFAYNKPTGVLSHSAKGDDVDIAMSVKGRTEGAKVFPIGRLDKDSHGLIILTNDGRITGKLLNPEENHEKEYVVITRDKIDEDFISKLETGVIIKDEYSKQKYKTKPCIVKILGLKKFSITLTEGKKRQVRRMVETLRNEVRDLLRIRIMNIDLKDLKENNLRRLRGMELSNFLKELGLN